MILEAFANLLSSVYARKSDHLLVQTFEHPSKLETHDGINSDEVFQRSSQVISIDEPKGNVIGSMFQVSLPNETGVLLLNMYGWFLKR